MTETPNETKRKARKRGDGEGSIMQRADGMWRGRLMVGQRPDGKPDLREVYAKRREGVQAKLDELRKQRSGGAVIDSTSMTVGDALNQYLLACKTRKLRETTIASYAEIARLYLRPTLGTMRLAKLRPEQVRQLLADMVDRKLSAATVRYARTVLHGAMGLMLREDKLVRNVVDAVRAPKVERQERTWLTPRDVAALLDTADGAHDRLLALWTVSAYSGCRPGELLGLKWPDVAWDAKTIAIRRNLTKVRGAGFQLTLPKTASGRRTVSLPDDAVNALRAHRQRQLEETLRLGSDYADQGLVFATHFGTPLARRNVIRAFKALLAKANLSGAFRLYDLRHAHATVALQGGVPIKVVSARLGHSSIKLTGDTYEHVVDDMDIDAAARIQDTIRAASRARKAD